MTRADRTSNAFAERDTGPDFSNGTASIDIIGPSPPLSNIGLALRRSLVPEIGVKHPSFGMTPPPAPTGVWPVSGSYFQLVRSRRRKLLSQPRSKAIAAMTHYNKILDRMCGFAPFFDEYDLKEVMPTVTAMNVVKASHSDLDEGAPLRVPRNHKLNPSVMQHVIRLWRQARRTGDQSEPELVLPTQTNLGWPFVFSQQGSLRPFTLGVLALAVNRAIRDGFSLHDVYGQVSTHFGPPVMLQGSRLQHTAKVIPLIDAGGFAWTKNFEPRYRAIFMGSKIGIIYNRRATKLLLRAAMSLPQHNQDRGYLKKTISGWLKDPRLKVVAVDVSKFDKAHGGQYLEHFAQAASEIMEDRRVKDNFLAEVKMPLTVFSGNDVYLTTDKIAPQLPSGVSFTTVCGLFYGDYLCHYLAHSAGLDLNGRGSSWDFVNWGDDIVMALPRAVDTKALFSNVTKELEIETTEEPVIRYLGFNYGDGPAMTTRGGYSVGRMVLKHFFPERPKVYPFSVIGYCARLQFIPDPKAFHDFAIRYAWSPSLGPAFPYTARHAVLDKALKDSLTAETFDASVLDFILHGLGVDDGSELLDSLDTDFDFTDWIGHGYTDFTDPIKALTDVDSENYNRAKHLISSVEKNGFAALPAFAQWLAGNWNLRFDKMVF